MSCIRLPKRIFPSKKALKKFLSTLRRHRRRLTAATKNSHRVFKKRRQHPTRTFYVDRLFQAEPADLRRPTTSSCSRTVQEVVKMEASSSSSSYSGGGGWKEYVESMPPVRGVDERAEEFISNFRQQMKIQRELSLLDYYEMLARST